MNRSKNRVVVVATVTAVVATMASASGGWAASATATATTSQSSSPQAPDAREIRSIDTAELGVNRPTGVAWDAGRQTLVVSGARNGGGTKLLGVTTGESRRGKTVLPSLDDTAIAAYNPRSHRLTVLEDGKRAVLAGDRLAARPWSSAAAARAASVSDPGGTAFSPDGTLHVLDATTSSIVNLSPGGTVARTRLPGLAGATLRGIAYEPVEDLLYVVDTKAEKLHAVNDSGQVVSTQDFVGADIADLQAMTFAPSADTTDDPAEQSLYVADAGDAAQFGRIAEVSLLAAVAPTFNVNATLVAARDTSPWPSPDPSGITTLSPDELLVSDAEIDEMTIYTGKNLFNSSLAGELTTSGTTAGPSAEVRPGWSNEPTGISFRSDSGHLYVSDDDKKSIFDISAAGPDDQFGTADDGVRTSFKTSAFGNTDPEDVGYDSSKNEMLLMDGLNKEVFRLKPGANGAFNGVAPGGDDIASQSDVERYGAVDPEGIVYDSARDTTVVLDGSSDAIYELDANGSLLNTISIGSASIQKAAGIVIAPASDGSTARHYYIADRGVDNSVDRPDENDGQIYELSATLAPITNRPPAANAGPDQLIDRTATATLTGRGVDDGVPTATLTYHWSKVSGPGTVALGTGSKASTTAKFSAIGTYVMRLKVSDSVLSDIDDVTVSVFAPGSARTVSIPIASGADDAQEGGGTNGKFVDLSSADNELGNDGPPTPDAMLNGLRFAGIPVPRGAEVISAKIQFSVDETSTGAASLTIRGEAVNNAPGYVSGSGGLSARLAAAPTSAKVSWAPPPWSAIREAGPGQLTPELKPILQQIVNRPGWAKNNAAAFMIKGTGRRTAEAKDGRTPPVLQLVFRTVPAQTGNAGAQVLTATVEQKMVRVGSTAVIKGTISRTAARQPLRLQRLNGRSWQTVRSTTLRAGAKVAYRFAVGSPKSRIDRYRVVAPAFAGRPAKVAPGAGRTLRVKVYSTRITRVKPRGDEFVTVKNTGAVTIPLRNWRLRNVTTGRELRLKSFTLLRGKSVRIHTGRGRTNSKNLYMSKPAMWGARGTAVLRDAAPSVADRFRY